MDKKDFAIGVLTVTATILLTTVLMLSIVTPGDARAFAQLDKGRGYTMFTGQVSDAIEQIYVINQQARLMNVYMYDINTNLLQPVQQIPLPEERAVGAARPGATITPPQGAPAEAPAVPGR